MDNSKKKISMLTKAAKCATTVSLCGIIAATCAYRVASIECNTNHSVDTICPLAKLETFLFGYEAGLEHQAADLERYRLMYPDHKEYTSDVTYQKGTEDTLPCVTYNEVYDYGDTKEIKPKSWTYLDGEFVAATEENLELKKIMR